MQKKLENKHKWVSKKSNKENEKNYRAQLIMKNVIQDLK